jgi:putative flippase GtrA
VPAVVAQFVRYGAVGVSNTLLSAAAFAAGVTAGLGPALAATLAFALGSVNGFVWNRRWTFARRGRPAAYVAVQFAGVLATDLLMSALGSVGTAAAYVMTTATVTIGTFIANRRYTFARPKHHVVPSTLKVPGTDLAVDVVVPVYNEVDDLEPNVARLHDYLRGEFPFTWRITVADNASTDGTLAAAGRLARERDGIRVVHLDQKGRGRALRAVWSRSDAAVVAYMDVDLSTDLHALLPLVAPLISGHSDLAIGTRLTHSSRVSRSIKRELISRCYNRLLRLALHTRFSDAQCGFKAIRAERARELPAGLRIHEVPVDWVDDPDSRVDVVSTAAADLKGIFRLLRTERSFNDLHAA